jgi:hypothetical protein
LKSGWATVTQELGGTRVSAIMVIIENAGGPGKTTMIAQRIPPFCFGPTFVSPLVGKTKTMGATATRTALDATNITIAVRCRAYARTTWIDSVSLTAISRSKALSRLLLDLHRAKLISPSARPHIDRNRR